MVDIAPNNVTELHPGTAEAKSKPRSAPRRKRKRRAAPRTAKPQNALLQTGPLQIAPPLHWIDDLAGPENVRPAYNIDDDEHEIGVIDRHRDWRDILDVLADLAAYACAFALAAVSWWFSANGMTVLFSGASTGVFVMATAMDGSKLVLAGWLSRSWRTLPWLARYGILLLIIGLAALSAASLYSQLVQAHTGHRGEAAAALEASIGDLDARIEVATANVADYDKQITTTVAAIAEATKRGKAMAGLDAVAGQRQARQKLADARNGAAGALAGLKSERARLAAKGHQEEMEAAPIRFVAEQLGLGGDQEKAIRLLILAMVLLCDPVSLVVVASVSSKRRKG
jgi:hypothetical protein